jgi:hypothetical protein
MNFLGCQICPVMMNGVVKEIFDNYIKIYLHGRLGVMYISKRLISGNEIIEPGYELNFYFSFIWVTEERFDYDYWGLFSDENIQPCLIGGKIIEVNDTAAKIKIDNLLGTIAVPRRWMFTDVELKEGLNVEFYFSRIDIKGKSNLTKEMI